MHQTVTLSKRDLRRILVLRDRLVALTDEIEQYANGAVPKRRRRRKAAPPAPPPKAAMPRRSRATSTVSTTP